LVLHRGSPQDPNALHVELQYDAETELEVSLINGNHFFLEANLNGSIPLKARLYLNNTFMGEMSKINENNFFILFPSHSLKEQMK